MPLLTLSFDTGTQSIIDVSLDGRAIAGVSGVALAKGLDKVLDNEGRDLLSALTRVNEPREQSLTRLSVAKLFGFAEGTAGNGGRHS